MGLFVVFLDGDWYGSTALVAVRADTLEAARDKAKAKYHPNNEHITLDLYRAIPKLEPIGELKFDQYGVSQPIDVSW